MIEMPLPEVSVPRGSLIATGGWCAPSEQMFEMLREWTIEDYQKALAAERAKRKAWKRRAKIAEAKLLLGKR